MLSFAEILLLLLLLQSCNASSRQCCHKLRNIVMFHLQAVWVHSAAARHSLLPFACHALGEMLVFMCKAAAAAAVAVLTTADTQFETTHVT